MRIIQLLPQLNEGGVERGTLDLNRILAKKGHDSFVISVGGNLTQQIQREGGTHYICDVII